MALTDELISQFVKVTKDEVEIKNETTAYGTIVVQDGSTFVKLDGSDLLTPISTTANVFDGNRVTVRIKDHSATVYGNLSDPSATGGSVEAIGNRITEAEILIADKVSTVYFDAQVARIDKLTTDNATIKGQITAQSGKIDALESDNVKINETLSTHRADIDDLDAHKLTATDADLLYAKIESLNTTNATVHNLQVDYGDFKVATTDKLSANEASINDLNTSKLSATDASLMFANIDFSNIGKAAIEQFFSKSGMIDNLVVGDGSVTGKLVGVTIVGDLIEGGTVVADKLVIQGTDGLYYKLNTDGVTTEAEQTEYNSLNGSIITANSITATKINVDDLVAFDATIGGFNITENSLYSGTKASIDNTTTGIYLDKDGQIAFGDANNFAKFYKDKDGNYKLEISAQSISFGSSNTTIENAIDEVKQEVDQTSASIYESMTEQNTTLLKTCEGFMLEALTAYTETGDFNAFKQTTQSQLQLLSDQITLNFTKQQEALSESNAELQGQINTITKHFIFDINGMTIGQPDSPYTIRLDNDELVFLTNGNEVQRFDVSGGTLMPQAKITESFTLLDYLFSKDSAGNVNCEYIGGET